jgi:hypothetical protein
MLKLLLIILVISAIIFVNGEELETFVLRRRRHMRNALHHRDIYPMHHYYGPRRRSWYSFATDWYHYLPCKSGCTNLGNGKWGCQYPSVSGCVFARDCHGC